MPSRRPSRRAALACLLVPALLAGCGEPAPPPAEGPNIVVWLVDTLRADHLSCYGYERPTSPNLDALAQAGVLFEQVHAHSNWTQPSVTAFMTGCFPPPYSGRFENSVPEGMTLASEWLTEHGYRAIARTVTAATSAQFGFAQGYEEYVELDQDLDRRQRKRRETDVFLAENVVDSALEWLATPAATDRPFFLMLHTVDPHEPYTRHPGGPLFAGEQPTEMDGSIEQLKTRKEAGEPFTPEERQFLIDLYDEEIHYNDQQLGRLVEGLRARGLLEDTLLVVVSDHGEELFERELIGHGHMNLHAELTHIPFVLHWPAALPAGVRVAELVREVDLMPTLLDLVGLPSLPDADGRSVAWLVRGQAPPQAYRPKVELDRGKSRGDLMGLRTPELLLLHDPSTRSDKHRRGTSALYALDDVGVAGRNVLAGQEEHADELLDYLEAWQQYREKRLRALGTQDQQPVDDATRARLEQLGYLGGEASPDAEDGPEPPREAAPDESGGDRDD